MKRIIVLGGTGFFGGLILDRLRKAGLEPLSASRSRGDLRIDANNLDNLRANVRQRDLIIDAAGPFQTRTPVLIDAAIRIGFDVIDLSDSAEYTAMVQQREAPISAAGIRVLTACSTLSTVSALVVQRSGIDEPLRIIARLLPASRITANPAAVESFLMSIEGADRGGLRVKSVDEVTLPRFYPSLRTIKFIVDSGHTSGNFLLRFAWFRRLIERHPEEAVKMIRRLGPKTGILTYEISSSLRHREQIFRGEKTHLLAVLPAIQAATAIAAGQYIHRGLVPPLNHVDGDRLFTTARDEGIEIVST